MFKQFENFLNDLNKKVNTLEEIIESNNKKVNDKLDLLLSFVQNESVRPMDDLGPIEVYDLEKAIPALEEDKEAVKNAANLIESVIKESLQEPAYTLEDALLDRDLGNIVSIHLLTVEDKEKFLQEVGVAGIKGEAPQISDTSEVLDTMPGYFLILDIMKANKEFFERPLIEEKEIVTIVQNFLKTISAEGTVALNDIEKSDTLKDVLVKEKEKLNDFFIMDDFDFAESIIVEDFHKYFFLPFMAFYNSETGKIIESVKTELDNMEPIIKNGEVIELVTEKTELSLLDFHGEVEATTKDEIEKAINQRMIKVNEDNSEELFMGNKTFALTEDYIEVNGEKLYEIMYLKDFKYTVDKTTMGILSGVKGGYVSKKAFIQEDVVIFPGANVPQYCVLAKGTIVPQSIPPFTKNFTEGAFLNEIAILDLDKTPYALNEDRISF